MIANNTINCKKLHSDAYIPTRTHTFDAGADLRAIEDCVVPSLFKAAIRYACEYTKRILWGYSGPVEPENMFATKVKTGISIEVPDGEVGLIMDRSSMGSKGLVVVGGVCDAGYLGEYCVCLLNLSFADYQIRKGDKVAQVVIVPCRNYQFNEVKELSETERGNRGFGEVSGR